MTRPEISLVAAQDAPDRIAMSTRTLVLLAAALLLIGLNMRPAVVAISPMLEDIRASTGISNVVAGFLTTVPLICFGIFAPLAPRLAHRFGMEATLMGVLVILLFGTAIRLIPTISGLFAGTVLIGTAVAVANVVATKMIKRDFDHCVSLLSGLHTTMLVAGAALAAGLTGPIGHSLGLSWRQGISIWALLAVAAIAAWAPYSMRGDTGGSSAERTSALGVWRSSLGWSIALFYALQSLIFYTTTAWIPSFYIAHGYSPTSAGWLLAICFVCAIVTSVSVPVIAERSARQSYLVVFGGILCAVALLGMILLATSAAMMWVIMLGLGLGVVLSLGITFMSTRASGHSTAGHLSAMSQCVGYLVAAIGPALFGAAKDATGDWNLGLAATAALTIPMTLMGFRSSRGGHV